MLHTYNIVCTSILAIALFAGASVSHLISPQIGAVACFAVLMIIGIIKLGQSLLSKAGDCLENREVTVKILRPAQAAIIAAALSIDGLAAGFGAALGGVNATVMLIVSLLAHMAAVPAGALLGRRLSKKTKFDISWIGGVVIIVLAVTKLF